MPFNVGLSLNLEITKAISRGVGGVQKLIGLARELQDSGSDLLVEDDLRVVFGQSYIVDEFARRQSTLLQMASPSAVSETRM